MIVGREKVVPLWVIHGWHLRMLDDNLSLSTDRDV